MRSCYKFAAVMPVLVATSYLFYLYKMGSTVEPNWLYGLPILAIAIMASLLLDRFRRLAFGDVLAFTCYGWGGGLATAWAMTGQPVWSVLIVVTPVALLTVAILYAINAQCVQQDKATGLRIRTTAIGLEGIQITYQTLLLSSYLLLAIIVMLEVMDRWVFLVLLSFPFAVRNIKLMKKATDHDQKIINKLHQRTALLVVLFALLMITGNMIAHLQY